MIIQVIGQRLRSRHRTADRLEVLGEYDEHGVVTLEPRAILRESAVLVGPVGSTARWEGLDDAIRPLLTELAEIRGDVYVGRHFLELPG